MASVMNRALPVFLILFCCQNWKVSASINWTDDSTFSWLSDDYSTTSTTSTATSASAFKRMSQRRTVFTGMNTPTKSQDTATTTTSITTSGKNTKSIGMNFLAKSKKRKTDDPDGMNLKFVEDTYGAFEWMKFHENEETPLDEYDEDGTFMQSSTLPSSFIYSTPERVQKPPTEPQSCESSCSSLFSTTTFGSTFSAPRFHSSSTTTMTKENGSSFTMVPPMNGSLSKMPCSLYSLFPKNISVISAESRHDLPDECRRELLERTILADDYRPFDRFLPTFNMGDSLLHDTVHEQLKCSHDLRNELDEDEDLQSLASERFDGIEVDLSSDQVEEIELIMSALEETDDHQKRPASITNEVSRKFSSFTFDETSPKAKSYQFNKPYLFTYPTTATTSADHQMTRVSPIGQPMRKVSSVQSYTSPIPFDMDENMEYKPWIPTDRPENFMDENFFRLKLKYDLRPFPLETEIIETPETEVGLNYFPDNYLPFQDYGEFVDDEVKSNAAIDKLKSLSDTVTEKVIKERKTKLQVKDRDPATSRHHVALNYAKAASEAGLPEGDWIHLFLAGGTIEFSEIPFDPLGPIEADEWTVTRCREFVSAIVYSIEYMAHFEEVLADFINDLFLKVIHKTKNQVKTPEDNIKLSREVTQSCRRMIKALINPTIFDSFISSVNTCITQDDAEELYDALVQIMKEFRVPEPANLPERIPPVRPEMEDPKYIAIDDEEEAKKVFAEDITEYQKAFKEHENEVSRDEIKARYLDDVARYRSIQKCRSFNFLKSLVHHLPEPVLKSDSKFATAALLEMDGKMAASSTTTTSSTASPKSSKRKNDQLIFGPNAHENQDFFDALFFSRILRACMILENTIDFTAIYIDPFLKKFQIPSKNSPIGLRYLKAINKFMKITRFNDVANEIPQIINYRRYLVAYLIREGADLMGINPEKVQSRTITLELLSLFESLHLYQVFDSCSTDLDLRAERLKTLLAFKEISYQIPIIYFTYNPVEYQVAVLIIESIAKEVPDIPKNLLNGYFEIFAMVKNVPLLSIFNRKVLKFKRSAASFARSSSEISSPKALENINEDLPLREKLPEDYEAVFEWNMSRRLKTIERTGNHFNYPYGTFASRILLARQFGVSFDASYFLPQLNENFTWTECLNFVNFYLEREAQLLIDRAYGKFLDANFYQVYRVHDSQKLLHRSAQLPRDEPTHHINLLISRALDSLPKEESEQILQVYSRPELFQILHNGLMRTNPAIILNVPKENAGRILKYFLNDLNVSEAFDIRFFL